MKRSLVEEDQIPEDENYYAEIEDDDVINIDDETSAGSTYISNRCTTVTVLPSRDDKDDTPDTTCSLANTKMKPLLFAVDSGCIGAGHVVNNPALLTDARKTDVVVADIRNRFILWM